MEECRKCLICYGNVPDWGGIGEVGPFKETSQVSDDLRTMFLLRKCLEIPSPLCQNFLVTHGSPSGWIHVCSRCLIWVQEAFLLNSQVKELLQKLDILYTKFRRQIQDTYSPPPITTTSSGRRGQNGEEGLSTSSITEQARALVFQQNQPKDTEIGGDVINNSEDLTSLVVLKEEPISWDPSVEDEPLLDVVMTIKDELVDVDEFYDENEGFDETDTGVVEDPTLVSNGPVHFQIGGSDGSQNQNELDEEASRARIEPSLPNKSGKRQHCRVCHKFVRGKGNLYRHERAHSLVIKCQMDSCERTFSRKDKMKDHFKRIHLKAMTIK